LRPIVNNMSLAPGLKFAPRGELGPKGWTWPLGVNLAPRGELWSQGGIFTPSFSPTVVNSLLFIRMDPRG
jgi:hypothetical protein